MFGKFEKALQAREDTIPVLQDVKVSGRLLYTEDSPAIPATYEKIPTTLFLAASLEAIEKWGFTSVTKGCADHPSTAFLVEQELRKKSPPFSYISQVPDIVQWCNDTLTPSAEDEILHTAIIYARLPEVTLEQASYLPFLVSLWVNKGTSSHVGKVGDCVVQHLLCTQILRYTKPDRSGYGFKFKDRKNNVYLWWTERPEILGPDPVGKTFHKAFRIKGHKIWKGVEETVIHYVLPPDGRVGDLYALNTARLAMSRLASSFSSLAPSRGLLSCMDEDEPS